MLRSQSAVLLRQVVCLSARLSVTLRYRDDIVWNSPIIISWLINTGCSLSANPNITDLLQREHPEILAVNGIGVGTEKVAFSVQKL